MNAQRISKLISDVLLVLLVAVAASHSIAYLISIPAQRTQALRYLGISPYAIAFVHPSFFSPKQLLFHYSDFQKNLDPLLYDELFSNRSLYRTIMFTFESNRQDVETTTRYFLCQPDRNPISREISVSQSPDAVEFVRFAQNSEQRLRVVCKP